MANKLEIVNWALRYIGESEITSLDDNNKNSKIVKAQYELTKQNELVKNIWNFSKRIVTLSPLDETLPDTNEFKAVFKLPADCIRLIKIGNVFYDIEETGQYYINNGRVYTRRNQTSLKILYVSKDTNESLFDPTFSKALALALAKDIVVTLNNDMQKLQLVGVQYSQEIRRARRTNGISKPNSRISDGYIVNQRYRY